MSSAVGRMNLLELREKHPALFYSQSWFVREAFMRVLPNDDAPTVPPKRIHHTGQIPKPDADLPAAVDLAHAFVLHPDDPMWDRWYWTSDKDASGQRVFVGAVNGKFELHRHLAITERFGQAAWR
jgi:hypothetical protein